MQNRVTKRHAIEWPKRVTSIAHRKIGEPDIPNWNKRERKLRNKGVPDYAIEQMKQFPGGPDAIGEWIDDAFDEVQTQFLKCGSLASRASRVSPSSLYIMIMPSAFFEPYYKIDVAGVYYPSLRQGKKSEYVSLRS